MKITDWWCLVAVLWAFYGSTLQAQEATGDQVSLEEDVMAVCWPAEQDTLVVGAGCESLLQDVSDMTIHHVDVLGEEYDDAEIRHMGMGVSSVVVLVSSAALSVTALVISLLNRRKMAELDPMIEFARRYDDLQRRIEVRRDDYSSQIYEQVVDFLDAVLQYGKTKILKREESIRESSR